MKKLQSNDDVANAWINRKEEAARGSNFFFQRDIIYSYGTHFPIAKIYPNRVILITTKNYSVTTSKHKIIVYSNISSQGYVVIEVNNITPVNKEQHESNVKELIYRILELKGRAKRAFKHADKYERQAHSKIEQLRAYVDIFQVDYIEIMDNFQDIIEYSVILN